MPQRTERQLATQDQLIYSPLEDVFTIWQCSPDKFRISYANTDFKLCASYPEAAIVPKIITDEDLRKVKQSINLTCSCSNMPNLLCILPPGVDVSGVA